MNEQEPRHSTDRDLEEALAYAARLRAAHPESGDPSPLSEPVAPTAPKKESAPAPSAPRRTERFRPAQEITLPDDDPTAGDSNSSKKAASSPAKKATAPAAKTPAKAKAAPSADIARQTTKPQPDEPAAEETSAGEGTKDGRFMRFLRRIIPVAGDPWWEIGRKLVFLVALIVLIGSSAMLLNESVILPKENTTMQDELLNLVEQSRKGELTEAEAAYAGYPSGINDDFKKLYYQNNDVRGRLIYSPCGIDNIVMYSGDNSYYLYHDFYRNSNKHGSLFFDADNNLNSASANYKSLVIYGHNMASGQMFAGLNQLASSVDTMKRAGCMITLETLFDTRQYKIFAVVIQDPASDIEHYYSIQATNFASNAEFVDYVRGLRARSLYDFNSVDVNENDNLLILYTCSPKSVSGLSDGRVGIIARQVRSGESASVDTSTITVNDDVIMPYRWYEQNKKTPHSFYTDGVLPDDGMNYTVAPTTDATTTDNAAATEPSPSTTTTPSIGRSDVTSPSTSRRTPVTPTAPPANVTTGTQPPTTPQAPDEPPVTEPPVTEPSATDAPDEPPVTEPSVTEPPVTEPATTEPPVTEPPVTEPPATEPPATEPPVAEESLADTSDTSPANP